MTTESNAELSLVKEEIRAAMNEDRVMIFLQPIYGTKKRRIVSAEVLTRIAREDGTYLMPDTFIPVAEEMGFIEELDTIIIKKACEFIKKYDITSLGLTHIEVNLSVRSGEKKSFVNTCRRVIKSCRIDPTLINFEITETAVLSRKAKLLSNMSQLISKGFNFSLDDFGCGESNLTYVIDMPVTIIKFDKNLIDSYSKSAKAQTVIKWMVDLAHEMGMKTVSEGVETEEMFSDMNEIGIDYIQGYYFSRPLPVGKFVAYVMAENGDAEEKDMEEGLSEVFIRT